MAARKKTTTRRRTPAKAANPRRRRRAPARRRTTRRRRRRNPSFDVKGTAMAAAGGGIAGGAAYALQGVDMEPKYKAALLLGGGALLGLAISGYSKPIGAGVAGGGFALGLNALLNLYMAKEQQQTQGIGAIQADLSAIPAYAVQRFGQTPMQQQYYHLPYGAQPQMGAVRYDLGAVQADLTAAAY